MLFNILVCKLAISKPSFWVRSNVFDELRLGFWEEQRKQAVALHTEGKELRNVTGVRRIGQRVGIGA